MTIEQAGAAPMTQSPGVREKKLSKPQLGLLKGMERGRSLFSSTLTGSIWSTDERGFTVRVHPRVFEALSIRRMIAPLSTVQATTYYRITNAARSALHPTGTEKSDA